MLCNVTVVCFYMDPDMGKASFVKKSIEVSN